MTAATVDQVVNDYLSRLAAAAADLPDGRRTELLAEIREHIEVARSVGVAADEATTRTMLDQLGEPDEIAAAAREELDDPHAGSAPPAATVETKPGTGLELAAVLMLTLGSFILLVGWVVGVVLLWASRRWTMREKLVGTLVVPTGPAGIFYIVSLGLFMLPTRVCTGTETSGGDVVETCSGPYVSPWISIPLFVISLVAPFVVAALLYSRARARADAEPPVSRPVATLAAERMWTGTEITAVALLGGGSVIALALFGPLGPLVVLAAALPFVWTSSRWTQREKWIGTTIAAAPMIAAILLVLTFRGV